MSTDIDCIDPDEKEESDKIKQQQVLFDYNKKINQYANMEIVDVLEDVKQYLDKYLISMALENNVELGDVWSLLNAKSQVKTKIKNGFRYVYFDNTWPAIRPVECLYVTYIQLRVANNKIPIGYTFIDTAGIRRYFIELNGSDLAQDVLLSKFTEYIEKDNQ